MTSKNLFINLQKEDMKKRIWLIALSVIAAFLLRPVFLLMRLQHLKNISISYRTDALNMVKSFYSPTNVSCALGIIIFAVFMGISSYAYLFSKKKTDFYHSIPLKRNKMFFAYYLNGVYIYLALYLVSQVVCLIITAVQGLLTPVIFTELFSAFCVQGIYFLFIYHTVILAVMLTGHLAVAVAASGVFLCYAPLMIQTFYGYFHMYLQTYFETSYSAFPGTKWTILSPISAYVRYIFLAGEFGMDGGKEATIFLIVSLIIALLLLSICVWLYGKRPSEMAEKAMVFRKTESIVRILLVIPAALLGAGLFSSIANNREGGWFWFGLIFTGILMHATMEVIFRFDFKAGLHHKLQAALCIAAAGMIAICFQHDVFGYDRYMPEEEQIESTAVAFSNIDNDRYDYQLEIIDGKLMEDNTSAVEELRQLENTKLTDIPSTMALAKFGIDDAQMRKSLEDDEDLYEKDDTVLSYVIRYNMKNHKTIYRSYTAKVEDVYEYMRVIYESPEYKAHENLLTEIVNTDSSLVQDVSIYDGMDVRVLNISKEYIPEILQTYVEELAELTIDDIQRENEILRISPQVDIGERYFPELNGYYIYPSFTKTIALLEKAGLAESNIVKSIEVSKIKSINVTGSLEEDPYDYSTYEDTYKEILYKKESDGKKIEELGAVLVPGAFSWNNYILRPCEEGLTFDVIYERENGTDSSMTMVVPKGQYPEFIYEDFKVVK